VVGVAAFVWLTSHSQKPTQRPVAERVRNLRIIEAPSVDVTPRAIGYGTSRPTKTWRAIAEVRGRITEIKAELKSGAFLGKGEHVITIDPQEYELVITQLEAEIAELEASLAELEIRKTNDGLSLEIEKASLDLAQSDLDRVRNLMDREVAAATELRDEERVVLAQRQKVQSIENSLALVPTQRNAVDASLRVRRSKLQQARLDLNKTKIEAPFACRIGDVSIESGQYVAMGELLFTADGTAATEIEVQTPIHHARNLIRSDTDRPLELTPDLETIRELIRIDAEVRVTAGEFVARWDARFDRIRERLDQDTRTVPIVVVVDKPYEKAIPGKRPPLFRDVFCEVELWGKSISNRVVVPRTALHGKKLFVIDDENRLRGREVDVLFEQDEFAVIAGGVESGERIIVSDPSPAIEGMLVRPEHDDELLARIVAEASGQARTK
jgi:RND family efflux transporter MFP subunit